MFTATEVLQLKLAVRHRQEDEEISAEEANALIKKLDALPKEPYTREKATSGTCLACEQEPKALDADSR